MVNFIVLIFNNLITNYILLDFYHQRFGIRTETSINLYNAVLYFLTSIFSVAVNLLNSTMLNIIYYIIVTFVLTFCIYKQKAITLTLNIVFLLSLILLEFICYYTYTYIINFILTSEASISITYMDTISSTFVILIFYYFNRGIFGKLKINHLTWQERFLLLIIPILSLLICFIGSTLVRYIPLPTIEIILLILMIFVILLNIIVYEVILSFSKFNNMKTEIALHKQENVFLIKYNTAIENQANELKHLKHDFIRHLNLLNSLLMKKKYKDAKEYITSISSNINNAKMHMFSRNTILNSLLQEKATIMEQANIIYKFDVLVSALSWIDGYDITTIFSNLLDNAIEANMPYKGKKFVNLCFEFKNSKLVIILKNSCGNESIYGSHNYGSPKENHKGYGLQNVMKSIEKYGGMFDISIDKHLCTCFIFIPIN